MTGLYLHMIAVVDLRGARGMRAPLGVQILSISCSFWENLAESYVGAPLGSWRPLLGEILDPPLDRKPLSRVTETDSGFSVAGNRLSKEGADVRFTKFSKKEKLCKI